MNHRSKDNQLEKHAVSEAASYVDRYNVDGVYTGNDEHFTDDSGQATITLVWNAENEAWACITPADKVITFLVKCGASDTPEAPSNEEISQILASKPVLIKCVNENRKHDLADQTYGLMDGSYKVMGVNESNGTWTCTVEINIEQYLKAFIEKTGSVIHVESGAATQQVVLTWDRDAGLWKAPADDEYAATFEVTCDPEQTGDLHIIDSFSKVLVTEASEKWMEKYDFPENPVFVLGDNRDLTEEEESELLSYDPDKIRIGPLSLHADHCMIIVHNEADRRSERG